MEGQGVSQSPVPCLGSRADYDRIDPFFLQTLSPAHSSPESDHIAHSFQLVLPPCRDGSPRLISMTDVFMIGFAQYIKQGHV
jgi:hypothetical protein